MRIKFLIIYFLALAFVQSADAQSFTDPVKKGQAKTRSIPSGKIPYDYTAMDWIRKGKAFMERRDYDKAVEQFESALKRDFHQGTTVAIYYSGLSYYYLNNSYMASRRFDDIILQYRYSRYLDDAIYHKALLLLSDRSASKQKTGLSDLLFLIDNSPKQEITKDAYAALRYHLFYRLPSSVVHAFAQSSPARHKTLMTEARCYHLLKDGKDADARWVHKSYLNAGGQSTYFLDGLFNMGSPLQAGVHYYEPNIMKLSLMLPLYLSKGKADSKKGKMGLEFYNGFKAAISDYEPHGRKKIFLQVFDTQRDATRIRQELQTMDQSQPDLVIGGIYNSSSRIISDWSERRGIPQIVPFSPTLPTRGKTNVFLAHPSTATHGRRMAEYARLKLGLRNVAVWTDQRHITEEIANGFISAFDSLGGRVVRIPVDSVFSRAKNQIVQKLSKMEKNDFDGFYIPLPGEEACGLILSEANFRRIKVQALGTPAWQWFQIIDKDLIQKFRLVFSTSYLAANDSSQYIAFHNDYLRKNKSVPSQYTVQGYDLGMYILNLLDRFDYRKGIPLSAFIRSYGLHHGIHLDYYFDKQQSNTIVHICTFKGGKVIRLK